MPFRKGKSGNPAGKPKGAKDHHPRSAKQAIRKLLDDFGGDVELITAVLNAGLKARAPASFPYLRLVVEHQLGQPDLAINQKTTIVHEHHDT